MEGNGMGFKYSPIILHICAANFNRQALLLRQLNEGFAHKTYRSTFVLNIQHSLCEQSFHSHL